MSIQGDKLESNHRATTSYAIPGKEIARKQGIHKHAGFVLIKLNTIFGPAYILEHRKSDKSFVKKIALYGGTREGDEEIAESAVKEIHEETGITVGAGRLDEILFFMGESEKGNPMAGQVFVLKYGMFPPFQKQRPNVWKIIRHQKEQRKLSRTQGAGGSGRQFDDQVGPPKIIRRYFGIWWVVNWSKFTPAAMYALLTEQHREKQGVL